MFNFARSSYLYKVVRPINYNFRLLLSYIELYGVIQLELIFWWHFKSSNVLQLINAALHLCIINVDCFLNFIELLCCFMKNIFCFWKVFAFIFNVFYLSRITNNYLLIQLFSLRFKSYNLTNSINTTFLYPLLFIY